MLEVELDIFSGMPNPSWILTRGEEQELADRIQQDPEQISPVFTSEERLGLGYRGFIIRVVKEDDGPWGRLQGYLKTPIPSEFRVGSAPAAADSSAAQWLIDTSARRVGVENELLEWASVGVHLITPRGDGDPSPRLGESHFREEGDEGSSVRGTWLEGEQCSAANSHYVDNGSFFNESAHVGKNNCYCFACNHRSGSRFARPGRFAGLPDGPITADDVKEGLYADGWRDTCQSPGGLTIGAAIAPGFDYHFWRLLSNGNEWLWGHKQGATPVRYDDEAGWRMKKYVTGAGSYIWIHPESCSRAPYDVFLGFFYQKNSTAFCK